MLSEIQEELDRINSFNDTIGNQVMREAILLYEETYKIIETYETNALETVIVPKWYKQKFMNLVQRVSLNLMEDKDSFYSYFFFQMEQSIRFDLASPTGVNFKAGKYIIYFNPLSFLSLTPEQMESSIKHEILHIISLHLLRARTLRSEYSKLAINLAMDVVVNNYLKDLQPDAVDLKWVNRTYNISLAPFQTFEYYVEQIQNALDKLSKAKETEEISENKAVKSSETDESVKLKFDPETTHDLWEESDSTDAETLLELTTLQVKQAIRGELSGYLESIIADMQPKDEEISWYEYLRKFLGSVAAEQRKTSMRLNRRQPWRLDLRGQLRSHIAKVTVAIDISGSISDEEFKQAIEQILQIVRNYRHEVTLLECDNVIQRSYPIRHLRDVQERLSVRGGTEFSPVFAYCNKIKPGLLIYFTDGEGEKELLETPQGYEVLWVLTGRANKLSLKEPYGIVTRLKPIEIVEDNITYADLRLSGFSMANMERNSGM